MYAVHDFIHLNLPGNVPRTDTFRKTNNARKIKRPVKTIAPAKKNNCSSARSNEGKTGG